MLRIWSRPAKLNGTVQQLEPVVVEAPSRRRSAASPPLFLLVPSLAVGGLVLLPLIYLVYRASQVGDNVWQYLLRDRTVEVLWNTVALAISVSVTAAAIAVPLAWLTTRSDLPYGSIIGMLCSLPLVIPSFVGALTIVAMLGPRGYLQGWLETAFGVQQLPSIYGFVGAWVTLSLFTFPYVYLNTRAGLRGIDPCQEEAARGLGMGPARAFVKTTLPQLRPAIVSGMLLSSLYAISDFGVVTLFRYDALTRAIYVQYQTSFDRTLAAVLALLLVAFTVSLLLVEMRWQGRAAYYRLGSGVARAHKPTRLGYWKVPALLGSGLILFSALGLPVVVLCGWLIRAVRRGDEFTNIQQASITSATLGGATALITLLAALPVALLATRYRSRVGRVAERMTYLGYGLPGIVIALSFVFIGANYLTSFYQTFPLLILAYMVRFVPQAVGSTKTSLLQISPRLEEAARNLGRSQAGAIWTVTMPLARPGMVAGATLVFLTVVKELPITLLLSPTGTRTLATEVWTAAGSGAYGQAALPALLLMGISAIPTVVLLTRERVASMRANQ
jgi:iron(III) transport system permease protein